MPQQISIVANKLSDYMNFKGNAHYFIQQHFHRKTAKNLYSPSNTATFRLYTTTKNLTWHCWQQASSVIQPLHTNQPNKIQCFADNDLLGFSRDLFVAGSDTIVATLLWTFICLINRPWVQEKVCSKNCSLRFVLFQTCTASFVKKNRDVRLLDHTGRCVFLLVEVSTVA